MRGSDAHIVAAAMEVDATPSLAPAEGVLRERGANLQQERDVDRGAKRARTEGASGSKREQWIELVR